MFVRNFEDIGCYPSDIEMTPTTLAPRRDPDRTISSGKRAIADLLRINLFFDQSEDYPATLPTVEALARKIIWLWGKIPNISRDARKERDIKSAFRLVRLHPRMAKVMGAEMRGRHFGMSGDIVVMFGVLPFGWGSPPIRFVRLSDALTKLHQLSGPADPAWNVPFAFRSSMFIDDGLFVELRIGDRRRRSVAEWEHLARGMLSQAAINEEKASDEGEWKGEQIFLGFAINTSSITIALPEGQKAGATILSPTSCSVSLVVG